MIEYAPAEVFPPGDFLREELEERGWSQVEFAEIIGRPPALVSDILKAKRAITPTTAIEIAAALGTSPMLWLNLDAAYQLWKAQTSGETPALRIQRSAKLRREYPVRDMVNRGWLAPSENPEVLEAQLCEFFEVANLEERPHFAHAAKKTAALEEYAELTGAQRAWLFRVKRIAEAMQVPGYSEVRLHEALSQMKHLLASPEAAREVPRLLEESGVSFLVVEPLPSAKMDGVCFWLDPQRPVVAMSMRFDRIDNFWFVLRHELEHVLQGHMSVDANIDEQLTEAESVPLQERIANEAAQEFCIPTAELEGFIARLRPVFPEKRLIAFAARLGVHPGIAAGQLRRKLDRWDLFTRHLVKVRDIVTAVAWTDGYGRTLPV